MVTRYLKMEVKHHWSSVCIHMVYGIYPYILYICSEYAKSPMTQELEARRDLDSTLILDLTAVKGTGASIDTLLLYFITSRNFEV